MRERVRERKRVRARAGTEVGEANFEEKEGFFEEARQGIVLGLGDVLLREVGHAALQKPVGHARGSVLQIVNINPWIRSVEVRWDRWHRKRLGDPA